MDFENVTPEEIKRAREQLGMTQPQFGDLIGVHFITVSKWERGLSTPTPHQEAIIRSCVKIAQSKSSERIGKSILSALVGAGVGVALHKLFKESFESNKSDNQGEK